MEDNFSAPHAQHARARDDEAVSRSNNASPTARPQWTGALAVILVLVAASLVGLPGLLRSARSSVQVLRVQDDSKCEWRLKRFLVDVGLQQHARALCGQGYNTLEDVLHMSLEQCVSGRCVTPGTCLVHLLHTSHFPHLLARPNFTSPNVSLVTRALTLAGWKVRASTSPRIGTGLRTQQQTCSAGGAARTMRQHTAGHSARQ